MILLPNRVSLAIAFATLAYVSNTSASCLSLKQSQGCPGFSNEYISTNATGRFSWYPKDDISAFDKALNDYVNGQANLEEFQSVFRCPGLDDLGGFSTDHGKSVIRYHRSMVCADLLFSEENINDCYGTVNVDGDRGSADKRRRDIDEDDAELQLAKILASSSIGVRPPMPTPLCRTTCNAWIDSLHGIITNTTLCQTSAGINRESSLESLRTKCHTSVYNGTPGNCIDGEDNELRTCGYQRVEDWCKYCKYATDYQETCTSIGIRVGKGAGVSNSPTANGKDSDDSSESPTSDPDSNSGLLAELDRQSRQERLFRIVAIVLSIAVGIFLLMLIAAMVTGHGIGGRDTKRRFFGGRDDATLVTQGADNQSEKGPADFVDCFIANVGKPRQVVRHFFARREDEISLQQGDIVTLQMAFDDGWVVGKNLTTGCEGTFPLMCVMESIAASIPAQWSVLPESKAASTENIRHPAKATTRRSSPHASLLGSMSLPASLEAPPSVANGNVSRISNLSTSHGPLSTSAHADSASRLQQGTRTLGQSKLGHTSDELIESHNKGRTFLGRIIGAFTSVSTSTAPSDSSSELPGFFRRLGISPFGGRDRDQPPSPPVPKNGRPHSFNVNHVVNVGASSPTRPRPSDLNISIPTFPSSNNGPSVNRYPAMPSRVSTGADRYVNTSILTASRINDTEMPAGPGFVRPPNFSYGEFAPASDLQSMNMGNSSVDTYQTASQFGMNGLGAQQTQATAANRNPS
ncbi:hypothetical protein FB645_006237 [Coemansia sp. IMI 203386]|nr:hypothetical protein FB645_006237 [Coemansia sp. IMI 203386]